MYVRDQKIEPFQLPTSRCISKTFTIPEATETYLGPYQIIYDGDFRRQLFSQKISTVDV